MVSDVQPCLRLNHSESCRNTLVLAGIYFLILQEMSCRHGWRNAVGGGGTGRDLPQGPINSISWGGLGGHNIYRRWVLLLLLNCFFSSCHSCIGGFSLFAKNLRGVAPPIRARVNNA